jgi:GNAT superfamily N-acetyltransferase
MAEIRMANVGDAGVITEHRHWMFEDNGYGAEGTLPKMDAAFEPWVTERLQDGRYVGLLLEEDERVVAGAGIFFMEFPPHWMDARAMRAYVLNVYVAPEGRGKGYAKRLMAEVMKVCETRGAGVVTLHASPMGRRIYEGMGFSETGEMKLRLGSVGE